ncbi:MAG: endonuclease VII domain-containing protein [Patescibacteria group bacterium]|nr:endonuclease VII domain-containing protein [Patescibacteria group bacterium]
MAKNHSTSQPTLFDSTPAMKRCSRCDTVKPVPDFHKNRRQPDGYTAECRACRKERYRRTCEARRLNPPVPSSPLRECLRCHAVKPVAEFNRSPHGREGLTPYCKACMNAYLSNKYARQKQDPIFREAKRNYSRANQRKNRHGMSQTQYEAMHKAQGGKCAICRQPESVPRRRGSDAPRDLCVDHNHLTEKRRELLCSLCNSGLGSFRENIAVMEAAIAYLKRHEEA